MGTKVSSANMGVVGAMTRGRIKADDDNTGANIRAHELREEGDRCGRRVGGTWKCVKTRKSKCI